MDDQPVKVRGHNDTVWSFPNMKVAIQFVEQAPVIEYNIMRLMGVEDIEFNPVHEPETMTPRAKAKWRFDWLSFLLGYGAMAFLAIVVFGVSIP